MALSCLFSKTCETTVVMHINCDKLKVLLSIFQMCLLWKLSTTLPPFFFNWNTVKKLTPWQKLQMLFVEQLISYLAAEVSMTCTHLFSSSLGVYILIGAGALMMLVGFLGCCGASQESQCMLGLVSAQGWCLKFEQHDEKGRKISLCNSRAADCGPRTITV